MTVIVDDSHNASALAAVIAALDNFPHERRTIVYSAGYGRRDSDILDQGRRLAGAFDRVVLYEDGSASDRVPGELTRLFREGISSAPAARVSEVLDVRDHRDAIEAAIERLGPGDLLVIQTEDHSVAPTVELMRRIADREMLIATGSAPSPPHAATV
jgi:cyanophycin synthetase